MRRISYRTAGNALLFLLLWVVIGLLFLWTPVPGALGIRGQLLVVWVLLSFGITGVTGAIMVLGAFNSAFPPVARPQAPHTAPAGVRAASQTGRRAQPASRPTQGR
ncbi:MAG: hypothetical protein WEC75_07705 [Dehalococcoidia bacterium]